MQYNENQNASEARHEESKCINIYVAGALAVSFKSIQRYRAMSEASVGASAFAAAASSAAPLPSSSSSSSERVETRLYEQRLGDGTIKDFCVESTQSFFSPLLDSSVAAYLGLVLLYQVCSRLLF
jgi:molybdopterin/thiamine biosynthesis adenylyltransferase